MTKHEIIDLIGSTYNSNNRATKGSGRGCHYYLDGIMCGVGMTLEYPKEIEEFSTGCDTTSVLDVFESSEALWAAQKKEFRGHDIDFWTDIQHLHDHSSNWTPDGLSFSGQDRVRSLKEIYATI